VVKAVPTTLTLNPFWPGVRPCKVYKTLQGLFRTF
jgi:hypothetical protein